VIKLDDVRPVINSSGDIGVFMIEQRDDEELKIEYVDGVVEYYYIPKYRLAYGVCQGCLVVGDGNVWYLMKDVVKAGNLLGMLADNNLEVYVPKSYAPLVLRVRSGDYEYYAIVSPIKEEILDEVKEFRMDDDFMLDIGGVRVHINDLWEGRLW